MTGILPLAPGDKIGVCAPSSYVEEELLNSGIALLTQWGFEVSIHPQTFAQHHQSAGTDKEKLSALHELYKDPEIKAIYAAAGGQRALHLLPHLDLQLIKNNPKPIIGYSDITSLLNYIHAQTGIVNWHAPVLKQLSPSINATYLQHAISGSPQSYSWETSSIYQNGCVTAPVIGGNLSVLQAMIGTEYAPKFNDAILMLEDIGEEYSSLDRTLCHLKHAGIFSALKGLIFGTFSNMKDTGRPFGFSFHDIITEHIEGLNIPIAIKAPFGHADLNYPLPIGHQITFEVNDQTAELSWS